MDGAEAGHSAERGQRADRVPLLLAARDQLRTGAQALPVVYKAFLRFGITEEIPVAEWAPRGSSESVANIVAQLRRHPTIPAVLLGNHGLLAFSRDALAAAQLIVIMEEAAELLLDANTLGGAKPFPASALERERPSTPAAMQPTAPVAVVPAATAQPATAVSAPATRVPAQPTSTAVSAQPTAVPPVATAVAIPAAWRYYTTAARATGTGLRYTIPYCNLYKLRRKASPIL